MVCNLSDDAAIELIHGHAVCMLNSDINLYEFHEGRNVSTVEGAGDADRGVPLIDDLYITVK